MGFKYNGCTYRDGVLYMIFDPIWVADDIHPVRVNEVRL